MFIDDNLDPYRPVNSGGPERHPHDPLISEIDDASYNSNAQLGYHRTGVTNRTAGTWSNGIPDRSRRIVISEDYLHAGSSLSARQLSINNNSRTSSRCKVIKWPILITLLPVTIPIKTIYWLIQELSIRDNSQDQNLEKLE